MKNSRKTKKRYTHILLFSIFASLCLHCLAVFSFHKHLLAYSALNKFFKVVISENKTPLLPKVQKEEIFVFSINQSQLKISDLTKDKSQCVGTGEVDGQNIVSNDSLQPYSINQSQLKINGQDKGQSEYASVGTGPNIVSNDMLQPHAVMVEKAPKIAQKATLVIDKKFNTCSTYVLKMYSKKENFIKTEVSKNEVLYKIQKKDNRDHIMSCLKAKVPEIDKLKGGPKIAYKEHTTYSLENIQDRPIIVSGVKQEEYKFHVQNYLFDPKNEEHHRVVADYLRKETLKKQQIKLAVAEKKSLPFLPFIPHVPSLSDLNTVSCGGDFDIDLEYVSKEDDLGYVFALTLIPKVERQFQRINQNFYFLIDKSNSIQNNRYASSRQALVSSINAMNKSDTFNICAFDNKIDMLFEKNKNPNHEYLSAAKKFLLSQKIGAFFSSKSLSLPFNEMLNNRYEKEEINNLILISNGEDLEKQKNCRLINQWSTLNNNKQSLYILAMESDKNLPVLELFAAKNNGQLIVSHTDKSIRRNLVRLIKQLDYPIAKNISVSIYDKDQPNVSIFSRKNKQTHLYYDQPFVLLGTVKSLDDFVIFIQGKNPEKWFNIKKEISFANARKGGSALSDKWAQHRANQYYDKYLRDGETENLRQAEEILLPHELTPAFKK